MTPGCHHVPTEYHEVVQLLKSTELAAVEKGISEGTATSIYHGNFSVNSNYTLAEVSVSGLTVDNITTILRDDCMSLIEFGIRFLGDEEATEGVQEYPEGEEPGPDEADAIIEKLGLSSGIGITYAI